MMGEKKKEKEISGRETNVNNQQTSSPCALTENRGGKHNEKIAPRLPSRLPLHACQGRPFPASKGKKRALKRQGLALSFVSVGSCLEWTV